MPIVVSELYGMYDKYAYFYFFLLLLFFLFFFAPLLLGISTCYSRKKAILSFGYHMLIFLSVVFSLRTKHVTSRHNLEEDERDNLQNKLESSSQKHK